MRRKAKTYSVIEAARATGFCRALVSRLCRRGEIGVKLSFPDTEYHIFRLSQKDISTLKARKKQGGQKASRKA